MNRLKPLKKMVQGTMAIAIATLMIAGLASTLRSEETKSDTPPNKDSSPSKTNSVVTAAPDAKPAAAPRQITGAELYSMHCNRCHPERYPTERTAAQWKTIVLHMQVRANLPPSQARLILKYLQENSGR
jgi:cytochrome c5